MCNMKRKAEEICSKLGKGEKKQVHGEPKEWGEKQVLGEGKGRGKNPGTQGWKGMGKKVARLEGRGGDEKHREAK